MTKVKQSDPNLLIASIELAAFSIFCAIDAEKESGHGDEALIAASKAAESGILDLAKIKPENGAVDSFHSTHSNLSGRFEEWQGETEETRERYRGYARVTLACAGLKKQADPITVLRVLTYRPSRMAYTPPVGQPA